MTFWKDEEFSGEQTGDKILVIMFVYIRMSGLSISCRAIKLPWKRDLGKVFCLFVFDKFIYFYLFYFWLCWVFINAHGLSLVAASGGYSLLWCAGFSLRWLLLLQSTGSRCAGFSSCGMQAQ